MSEEKKERIYVDGFRTFAKRDKAPDWVKGALVIDIAKFKDFVNSHRQYLTKYKGSDQMRCDLLETKDGRISVVLDTYGFKVQDDTGIPMSDLENDAHKEPVAKSMKPPVKHDPTPVDDGGLPF